MNSNRSRKGLVGGGGLPVAYLQAAASADAWASLADLGRSRHSPDPIVGDNRGCLPLEVPMGFFNAPSFSRQIWLAAFHKQKLYSVKYKPRIFLPKVAER